jgi:hypothetical protein
MDMKQYYKKVREQEAEIRPVHVVVVSRETADGGLPGVLTEVTRRVASQLIVEGRAELANEAAVQTYRASEAQKRAQYKREQTASRLQVQVVAKDDQVTALSE